MILAALVLGALVAPQETQPPKSPPSAPPMSWTGVLSEEEFKKLHELRADAAPAPRGRMIEIGAQRAYLSLPLDAKAPLPAVIVIHEWYGLNAHIKHWADRLAADGYAALAVDLYGGKVAENSDEASTLMHGVDEERALATLLEAHRFLASDARVRASKRASLGWCFGGAWSLRLALAAPDLDAAVLYYGRLVTDVERLRAVRAPILGVFGTRDRGIPTSAVDAFEQALRTAERDARILRYEADHAFANPSGARYDEKAATAAWTETRTFLARHLKPTGSAAPDPATMRTYQLGFLKAGPTRKDPLAADVAARLQEAHLAHIASMAARGEIVVAGPMLERPGDDPIIGILIFTVPRDRAEALAAEDPLVQAGRLRCELVGWYGPKWLADHRPR